MEHVSYQLTLPSQFQVQQVVKVQFTQTETPITATVTGVHFYSGKVKYDLELWLMWDGEESFTRIYNVDSVFVTAA